MNNYHLLDTVALLFDITDKNLYQGQVGTIVEKLDNETFEVEFSSKNGETIALVPLKEKDIMLLHFERVTA